MQINPMSLVAFLCGFGFHFIVFFSPFPFAYYQAFMMAFIVEFDMLDSFIDCPIEPKTLAFRCILFGLSAVSVKLFGR